MSLNRSEQMLFDYVRHNPEEGHFWKAKVKNIVNGSAEIGSAINRLDFDLWHYLDERSAVVPDFREARRTFGSQRISMKNLAEHLVRIWTAPRPKPRTLAEGADSAGERLPNG